MLHATRGELELPSLACLLSTRKFNGYLIQPIPNVLLDRGVDPTGDSWVSDSLSSHPHGNQENSMNNLNL